MQTTVHENFPPAESLMRDVLRNGEPIAHEYPLVFEPRFAGRLVTAEEPTDQGHELRSTCAILKRELVLAGTRMPVGFIGSVVTHPEHRGRGWGRRVLAQAQESLLDEGCALALLWAEDPGYYERQGYQPVGTELAYLVDPALSAVLPSMRRVREARADDFDALFELYCAKTVRVERTAEEMRALLSISEMEVLVREDPSGATVAYSCVGRGADFASVVHEWAGAGEDVLATLQGHIQRRLEISDRDPLVMMVPADDNLRNFFDLIEAPSVTGVLGMAKLLDPAALLPLLEGLSGDRVDVSTANDGSVTLTGPAGLCSLGPEDLLSTTFEPKGARARVERLEDALGTELGSLPLRPFVWGLDSI